MREKIPQEFHNAAITRDELGVCYQMLGQHDEASAIRLKKGLAAVVCSNEPCSQSAGMAGKEALLRCGGCKSIWYCSRKCQKKDWKAQHKAVCKAAIGDKST